MKLKTVFLIAATTGALLAAGCGSDDGGGSNGGGGDDASSVCAECDVQNAAAIQACQEFYNVCRTDDAGSSEDCAVGARQRCGA